MLHSLRQGVFQGVCQQGTERREWLFSDACAGRAAILAGAAKAVPVTAGADVLASGPKRGYTIAVRGYPPRVGTAHNSRKGKGGYQPCGACF